MQDLQIYLSEIIQISKTLISSLNKIHIISIIFDTSMDLLGVGKKYYTVRIITL